tara:strand:- start:1070 stop:1531 length:462 start_codon:yes stop_codon:yes gene_type:complete
MELKIINKKEEPLLSRTKVEAEVVFEKTTPSREEIKSKLGKDLGKDEKLIVVKNIYTQYGQKKAKNLSYVYEKEEDLKRIEVEKKEKKEGEKAEEKPTKEQPKEDKKEGKAEQKEAKTEEKPKESKTEEKPKEAKQENQKVQQKKEATKENKK